MDQIRRRPLVSAEEELRLAAQIKEGDRQAEKRLIEANLRFVVGVASNYQNQGLPLEDLVNAGNIGLVRAARRFEPDKNFKFISYAVWWIRQAILQELADSSRIVRIPLNKVQTISRVRKKREEIQQRTQGSHVSHDELAEHLEMKKDTVHEVVTADSKTLSFDSPSGDSERPLLDSFGNQDHFEDFSVKRDNQRIIDGLFECLTPKEQRVVELYYGLNGIEHPRTLEEVGQMMSLTRERIRQLKEVAMKKLRQKAPIYS